MFGIPSSFGGIFLCVICSVLHNNVPFNSPSFPNRRVLRLFYRVECNLQFVAQTLHSHFVTAFETGFLEPFATKADFGHERVLVPCAWEVFAVDGQAPLGAI